MIDKDSENSSLSSILERERIDRLLISFSIVYRIVILCVICTSFVPDEIFQFVEPSHSIVSGIGIRTWEWDAEHRIRSFVPLLPLAASYKVLSILGLDDADNLRILPRLLFTLLAILSDVHFMRLCRIVLRTHCKRGDLRVLHNHGYHTHTIASSYLLEPCQIAFVLHVLSWSLSYCFPRTLGNSLETFLLIVGSSLLFGDISAPICWNDFVLDRHVHSHNQQQELKEKNRCAHSVSTLSIAIAVISVYARPTAVLIWVPLILLRLGTLDQPFKVIIKQCVPVTIAIVQLCVLVDSYMYGRITVPAWQFYSANVVKGYAGLFGVQPWHWSATQGLPIVLGVYFPVLLIGLICGTKSTLLRILVAVSLWYAFGLNIISAHMEFRFLLPCLPFLHMLCGSVLREGLLWSYGKKRQWWVEPCCRYGTYSALTVQVLVLVYLIRFHQCGTEEAVGLIGKDIREHHLPIHCPDSATTCSHHAVNIYLAGPCFAFPGYAGLHLPLAGYDTSRIRIHTTPCELRMEPHMYFDAQPIHHLHSQLSDHDSDNATYTVDYLLTFDSYLDVLNDTIRAHSFAQNDKLFPVLDHAYFKYDLDDPHPKKRVYIFKRQKIKMHIAYDGSDTSAPTSSPEAAPLAEPLPAPSPSPTDGAPTPAPFDSFVASGGTIPALFMMQ